MNNNTRIALAGLLSATGAFINALAAEFGNSPSGGGVTPEAAQGVDPTPGAAKPKKTPKAEKPAEKPAETHAAAAASEETAEQAEKTKAKTYEELKAMIEPLVKNAQGPDVKKVIAKYAVNLQELATKPEHHAAFETDLAALSY